MNKQSLLYLIPRGTFYNSKSEVIEEGNNLHNELFNEDRELYACALIFNNATYYTKGLIIEKLLSNSLYKDNNKEIIEKDPKRIELEDSLINYALMNESITHALKILLGLKEKKINNERTTKIILTFIFKRNNTDYICLKYKNKIKQLLVHALGMPKINAILTNTDKGKKFFNKYIRVYNNMCDIEIINFVFNKPFNYTNEFFIEYLKVADAFKENRVNEVRGTVLPIEVLEGFSSFYNRSVNLAELITKANVSTKQKIQMQNAVKKHSDNKVEIKIDLTKYSMVDLMKYMYNKSDISVKEIEEIQDILSNKATEIASNLHLEEKDTCLVVDYSLSHAGNGTSINHPFYMNYILTMILEKFYEINGLRHNTLIVGSKRNELGLLVPSGDSCLYEPLFKGLENDYKNFIFVSDGFNNVGDFDEIYKAINRISGTTAIQFNPVFSPKDMSCKGLSDIIPTIPFRDEKDIEFFELNYLFNSNPQSFKEIVRKKILK